MKNVRLRVLTASLLELEVVWLRGAKDLSHRHVEVQYYSSVEVLAALEAQVSEHKGFIVRFVLQGLVILDIVGKPLDV